MVDVMKGSKYFTIGSPGDEEYDAAKFTQLKRLICEGIKGILQKLSYLKLEIQTITTADMISDKKLICNCIIDVSKALADYPLGKGYEPSKFPPGCAFQPKLIAFHTNMDLLIWENCSKVSIIEDYVLNSKNVAKVITVGVSVRNVQKILKAISSDVFEQLEYMDHFGADDVAFTSSSPNYPLSPQMPVDSKFATMAAKDQLSPSLRGSRPSPNSPNLSLLSLQDVFRNPDSPQGSPMDSPVGSPMKLTEKFHSTQRIKVSPRADLKQANVVLRSGVLTVRGTKSKLLQEMADVDSTVEKKMPTIRQSQQELVSEILAENAEDVTWDPQQLRGRLSALRKKGRRDSDQCGENLMSLFVPPTATPASPAASELRRHAMLDENNNKMIAKVTGYHMDLGQSNITHPPLPHEMRFIDTELDIPYYTTQFFPYEHFNFIGVEKNSSGPQRHVLVSVVNNKVQSNSSKTNYEFKVLIRNAERDELVTFTTTSGSESVNCKKALQIVKKNVSKLSNFSLEEVDDLQFRVQLKDFECKQLRSQYRMGVLYCKDGQTLEDDMYSNVDPSPYFTEFLEVLGTTIQLEGWKKFKGGLDVKGGSTGTHAVYTNYNTFDIMFHVSTMLPFQADDLQRVERKRHIGNDVIVVVFMDIAPGEEPTTKFDPSIMRSQFNHVFIVVQVDHNYVPQHSEDHGTHYKIAVTYKDGVPTFGPVFPRTFSFAKDKFREFLLTKLINGERAALHAPIFAQKIKRTRREGIKLLYDTTHKGS